MTEKTQINPNLSGGVNATVVNRAVAGASGSATVLKPNLSAEGQIPSGAMLCERFRVVEKMAVTTGEADLYLCECDQTQYVAKVYRRAAALKPEVARKLKSLDSPFVAPLVETGTFCGAPVEILPYYRRGSMQGRKFNYEQLRRKIIPALNEGLKCLHSANIIHKDLKPSNLMLTDDGKSLAIIDFGISSMTEEGSTVVVTRTGMTPEYSAPETFKGLFLSHSDYYSMGITLYELFCGKTPYHGMSAEDIEKYVSIQRIPFPKEMPQDLQELIRALTYYDISNRRDLSNPNRRWGYEEVRKWLRNEKQTIPGEGVDRKVVKPYPFCGKNYTNRAELVRALVENWSEGKKQLFRGTLTNYYRTFDVETARLCQAAEAEAAKVSGRDDLIFWQTMCALEPGSQDFFWKGRVFAGLPALGRELLEQLRRGNASMNEFMENVLQQKLMSRYVTMKDPENKRLIDALEALETAHIGFENMPRDRRVNLYLAAYMLSGQRVLYVDGQEFHTIDELISYMREILGPNNENLERFKEFCHLLMEQYDNLTPALESWLIALGRREAVDQWKAEMRSVGSP